MSHDIEIPYTLYAPKCTFSSVITTTLESKDSEKGGTQCLIQHDRMILTWEGGKYSKHIMLNKENNFRFIKSWNHYNKYNQFMQAMNSVAKHQAKQS